MELKGQDGIEATITAIKAKQKKVSASTNVAQIFTGGRADFLCWKFFTRKSGMPTSTFLRAGNSNPGTGCLAARRTPLPEFC